jgi:hypothetical protein
MNIDPLALRVARRHSGEVVFHEVPGVSAQLIFSDGGVVTADDVRRILEDRVHLAAVWFCPTCSSTRRNVVLWEGIGADGTTTSGRLVLHAGAAVDHVVAWAEIVLDPEDDSPQAPNISHRLREIAHRASALVAHLREGKLPLHEVVAAVTGIVDAAEAAESGIPQRAQHARR